MANIEKYIDNITVPSGNDTVTNYLVDTVSGYLKTIPYLTCTDTASTVAKTTTLISGVFTEDNLVAGAQVMVKFTNFNTATAPTLSVNGTTAKLIKRYGTQPPSTSAPTSWNNGSVVSFVYDGTYWQQVGFLNSTYSEISYDYITNGSGSFTGLISGRRAKTAVETFAPVKSVNGDTGDVVITVPTATSDLTNDSGFITGSEVPANETDPTVPSWAKASTKPSYTATEVGALPDDTFIPTKTSDLINDSDFMSGMTILLYGHSTWQDFITAYTKKHVVYCRASSQSNPATGSQTRLAFMAYVNNADSPTEVEFQYYRSVNTHTASQQGDQVYVYKLTSNGTWTVTVREASVKVAAGTGITGTYSSGTMTLSLNGTLPTKTSDLTNDSGFITGAQVPSNETDPTVPAWAKSASKPSYTADEVGAPELFTVTVTQEVSGETDIFETDYTAEEVLSQINAGHYCILYDGVNDFVNYPFVGYSPSHDSLLFDSITIQNDAWINVFGFEMPLDDYRGNNIVYFHNYRVAIPFPPSAGSTATAVSTATSGGSATTYSRSDHVHSISSSTITTALGYTPYNSTNPSGYITASDVPSAGTSATAVGTTASGGSATTWSKSDHVHSINNTTIISALGYTPYNSTNPNGYSSAIIRRWS